MGEAMVAEGPGPEEAQGAPFGARERTAGHRAWDICGRARRLHDLDLDLLVLALEHAVVLGAAAVAAATPEDVRPAPVRAARLFAAVQVKLARGVPGPASLARFAPLLERLPDGWASVLRERLGRSAGARPSATVVELRRDDRQSGD